MGDGTTVAVIGLGPAGLVAVKNLAEEGFDVTGFDRHSYIGGLWQYNEADQTSVMETTVVNISRERGCFTDYPFPKDIPSYPTATQVQQYLANYANHFNLAPRLRLNTCIKQVTFDENRKKWVLDIEGHGLEYFDKTVIAIGGMVGKPNLPAIEGMEKLGANSVHSRAFKRPQDFEGKRVMVVGFGNSAADTATQLVGVAGKVYLAHRHGARILPRSFNGAPIDHTHSLRLFTLQSLILAYFPRFGDKFFDKFMKSLQDKSFTLRPEWGFEPPQRLPIVTDNLVPCLKAGSIESTKGIKRILGYTTVELEDGREVEIDALIWCTGYKSDFSILDGRFDPSTCPTAWASADGSNDRSLFRLYHNVFSLVKPDSLAFLGHVHFALGGFQIFDMASQAIGQVWKGASSLPTQCEMSAAVEKHHAWLADLAHGGHNISPGTTDAGPWMRAMDHLAGTGVNDYLGYGLKGWLFWLQERTYCNLLMGGIWSPHIHRVFEGKRKAWGNARQEIERVNEAVAANKRRQEKAKAV
ncbi:dimethylaniline monooxygenase 2 [Pyrenochaeta sp. MPI-SDFR-AT-0127]|nr:dimethylaniline monooxygenase 2 [Pyrenochaeta sp. MPI-SDFR-AT-0127]